MKDYVLKYNYIFKYGLKTLIIPILMLIFGIKIYNSYIILISIGLIVICINFFKRPNFDIKKDDNIILAPSFGRIQKIMKINNNIYISIFLSLFDPHIQYIPYDGFLINQIYKHGTFRAAFLFEKSTFNERMIHNIVTKIGTISVVQIAGMIARTIVPFLKQQTKVIKGEELGMIKFGSRVDIIVPIKENMKILIKQGQYVYGGQTPLIRIDE
tara:strand:+ start:813 stop:1451 length:639 start_codon:yes stop_codon:yes gene_type:complete